MTKGYYRKAHDRKDGSHVKGTYVKSTEGKTKWIQTLNKAMARKGTKGSFTKAKLEAAKKYPDMKFTNDAAGTVRFANAVLAEKIPGLKSEKFKDKARLAKIFVKMSR